MDNITKAERSKQMSLVRSKDTKPEMIVRRILHAKGYRYRLHRHDLPGKPDIVFPARNKVIFVQGCFWHGHKCRLGRIPKSRVEFWRNKIENNAKRDSVAKSELKKLGWSILYVWECELRKMDREKLKRKLFRYLENGAK